MSSKKVVLYKHTQSENEALEGSMLPCFQISPNIEIKDIPTNGEEYLMKVIQERKKYSSVTISTNDYSQFAQNQSCFAEEIENVVAPEYLIPTKEWQNLQVADFSEIRMYISRLKAKKQLWPKDFNIISFDENNKYLWKEFFDNNEPTLTSILSLKSSMLEKGMMYLVKKKLKHIKAGDTIDYKTGQWIYAFLVRTRQPPLSETVSILRMLARRCAEIRSHFDAEDEDTRISVMSLNLFICLVSRYFRQFDLADPFPSKTYVNITNENTTDY